jgi:hypothetical protein
MPPVKRARRETSAVFYGRVISTLIDANLPFLVGGTYAIAEYTGVMRPTKDLDLFLQRHTLDDAFRAIARAGDRTELTHSHFLGKIYAGRLFVDVIFASGNGWCQVDDTWFAHAVPGQAFGLPVRFCPIEEMIWSKAYVMERERYDGHDIAHLIRAGADRIDWSRLVGRFGAHWRVLLAHLVLFGFIYPGDRALIPRPVIEPLLARLADEPALSSEMTLCRGTLLSRSQYKHDVNGLGLVDARLAPAGPMTAEQIACWDEGLPHPPPAERRSRAR